MIDIHCHLIPDIDDGSKSMEESLDLIKIAISQGITDIICTPHYKINRFETSATETIMRFLELQQASSLLPIRLYLGNEIYFTEQLTSLLEDKQALPLACSKYYLFEFSFTDYPKNALDVIYDTIACGYTPILAHPERYLPLQKDPSIILSLLKEGCLMQCNASSLTGEFGRDAKNLAWYMLENNCYHFIGSDTHNLKRYFTYQEVYPLIANKIGIEKTNQLFYSNAKHIITNQPLNVKIPTSFTKKRSY